MYQQVIDTNVLGSEIQAAGLETNGSQLATD